jgi:hypothetical protein
VELEPEVEEWLDTIWIKEFASVLPHIERLADRGSALRMPASRSLGEGLFVLRFDLNRVCVADLVLLRRREAHRVADGVP